MTLVVNMFGGPGCGKSTSAAGLFHQLKMKGYECEYVTEYAKDIVWDEAYNKLNNQIYVFAHQHNRMHRLMGKVDIIITDSPILLGGYYGKQYGNNVTPALENLITHEHLTQDRFNVFLNRVVPYNKNGRLQTEDQITQVDADLKQLIQDVEPNLDNYMEVDGNSHAVSTILSRLELEFNKYNIQKNT